MSMVLWRRHHLEVEASERYDRAAARVLIMPGKRVMSKLKMLNNFSFGVLAALVLDCRKPSGADGGEGVMQETASFDFAIAAWAARFQGLLARASIHVKEINLNMPDHKPIQKYIRFINR
jgi:hypothetical protein